MRLRVTAFVVLTACGVTLHACGTTSTPGTSAAADASVTDSGQDTSASEEASTSDAGVIVADCSVGATPCNLAPDSRDTEGVAAIGGSVVFTERRAAGAVREVRLTGGVVTNVAASVMPTSIGMLGPISSACGSLCTSPAVVSWISEGPSPSLQQRELSHGTPPCCPEVSTTPHPLTAGGRVIGASQTFVWSRPISDTIEWRDAFGFQPLTSSAAPGGPFALAHTDTWLYWTQRSSAGEVRRNSVLGGGVSVQSTAARGTYPNIEAVAASTTTVAWTSASGVFATAAKGASFVDTEPELLDAATDGRGIIVTLDAVYYLAGGELRTKTRGAAGAPTTIASVCPGYRWLAQDTSQLVVHPGAVVRSLVWTCGADGGVYRIPGTDP